MAIKEFWSPTTEHWAALCALNPRPSEVQEVDLSWTKLWGQLGTGITEFPSLSGLGKPDFIPNIVGDGVKAPAERVRKIRLKPTVGQRRVLNHWFDTARWTYNRCVNAIEEHGCERSKKALRASCVNNDLWSTENSWVKETPYDIRNEAMNDVLKAYKTNFTAKRRQFKIKYKSRKAPSDSIVIHSKHWKSAGLFYPKTFGKIPIKGCEPLPTALDYDTRLQRTRLGEFYLCVLSPLVRRSESQAPPNDSGAEVIALDPGVRTFLTGYSPDGGFIEMGKGDIARISRLCWSLDRLQSKWSQSGVKHRQRYSMQRAGRRLRKKIQNLIRDFHHTAAKALCMGARTILIPAFETRDKVSKIKRRIGSKTARAMLTWSHYRFRKILEDKARAYPWCSVFVVNESYTSMTCGRCGQLHRTLGAAKTFQCPSCKLTIDRDVNGARNILLRFMTMDARARQAGFALGPSPGPPRRGGLPN